MKFLPAMLERAMAAVPLTIADGDDPDFPLIYVSPSFCTLTGYSPDEVLGRNCRLLEHPQSDLSVRTRLRDCLKRRVPFRGLLRNVRKDGREFWNEVIVTHVIDDDGRNLVVGVQHDATAQVASEAALMAMHRQAIAVLDEGIVVQDHDSSIVSANAAACAILGLSEAQMQGRDSLDPRWRTVCEDGQPRLGPQHPSVQVLRDGQARHGEIMGIHRPDGSLAWLSINSAPVPSPQGGLRATVTSFTDITAQRQRERALVEFGAFQQALLNAADYAIISTDAHGVIRVFNATAERWLDWTAAEMIGLQTPAVIHVVAEVVVRAADLTRELGRPVAPGFDAFVALARERAVPDEREWTYVRRNGSTFPVLLSVTAVRDQDGELIAYLGVAADITRRKRMEAERERARAEAEAAARHKAEFVATISHEIRTPLNGIIGMTSLVMDTDLDEHQREQLATIRACSDDLLALVNDVLDFSKADGGQMQLENIAFDPLEVAEAALLRVAGQAQDKGLDLALEAPASLPRLVGDPLRLKQMLLNLLGNAVKFTEVGQIVLRLALGQAGNRAQLTCSVIDTGPGIPLAAQQRLFEPFTQVDASTTRRHGGTGLGLAIVRRLAQAMAGEVTVVSGRGEGAAFTITVSLPKAGAAEVVAPTRRSGRVLVLSAQAATRVGVERMLESWGWQVEGLADPIEVVARLAEDPVDLLILDGRCGEPGAAAIIAMARHEAAWVTVPVIVLSTLADGQAWGLGITRVPLPVRRDALRAAVGG